MKQAGVREKNLRFSRYTCFFYQGHRSGARKQMLSGFFKYEIGKNCASGMIILY